MNNLNEKFDTNLYSRQLGVYGLETMKKIIKLNILIYGMRGLGFEISKNIILAGPKKVTIFDPNISEINDLTANFYLTKDDIKQNKRRDEAVIKKLSLLNPYVTVEIMEGDDLLKNIQNNLLNKELKYDVVLISEFLARDKITEINMICRQNNIGFIYTVELGIYGFCFVDFGDNFYVKDANGKDPLKYYIKSITKDKKGIITIDTNSERLKLSNKDKVSFKEIEGMTELNNCSPMNIKILSDNTIEIGDTSNFSDYISGGIIYEVKYPIEYHFKSLEERFEIPYSEEEDIPEQIDFSKTNTNEMIHIGILALNEFYKEYKFLPELNNEQQAKKLIKIGKDIYEKKNNEDLFWLNGLKEEIKNFDEILEKTLLRISLWSRAEISPIASFLGGVSAQEILKYTGKYNPIHQWIWMDFSETVENLDEKVDRQLKNDRYDDQIAIYGNKIHEELTNSNIFIIGAGALGCEFLKTFSLMGISSKENKNATITDNDNIEISNLNRQFLFKYDDINQSKSITACKVSKEMNSDFNCCPMNVKIGMETENIFDEEFWNKQDYIINAVDNIEARKYISNQCLIYKKILIDSGTLGLIANSQVIIPDKTIKYIEPQNLEEREIAMCTLRNFPTSITHCIEWARDNFDNYFVKIIQDLKKFCENKEKYYEDLEKIDNIEIQIKNLEKIINYSKLILNKNFDDCLEIAFNEYISKYNNNIIQILTDHPIDSLNDDGTKFWGGNKRIPIPLPFDSENELIILYIKKYAQILSKSLSIPINDNNEYIIEKCKAFKVNEFIPIQKSTKIKNRYTRKTEQEENSEEKKLKKKKKIEEIEERLKNQKKNLEKVKEKANQIIIPNYSEISNDFKIEEFDKDDESKGHVEFIYAASNLRAKNFKIENCDIYKVKIIAGKIIPAIATTTAAIVGLVSMQLYSLKQTENINFLRDCNINFIFNNYMFTSPNECEYEKSEDNNNIKFIPDKFTVWDFIEIHKSMTINEFIQYIKKEYNVDIKSISSNYLNIYESNIGGCNDYNNKIEDVFNKISKIKLFENKKFLILDILGNIGNLEAKFPRIKYIFK